MRILVIGAGIAGLAAAALLERKGHAVTLIERERHEHQGFSIGVWHLGLDVLRELGIEPRGMSVREFVLTDETGAVLTKHPLGDGAMLQMLRAELHNGLRGKVAGKILEGVTVSVTKEGEVTFSNGTKDQYDLIVAADGVHSETRAQHFPSAKATSIGWNGWYFWFDGKHLEKEYDGAALEHWKPGGFFGAFPHGGHKVCAYIGMPADRGDDLSSIRRAFVSWPVLTHILADLKEEDLYPAHVFDVKAPAWRSGKIILIGDAAHAMMPWSGMGAAMALEDAKELADTLTTSVQESLARYEQKRRVRVELAHNQTQMFWRVIGASPVSGTLWKSAVRHLPHSLFDRNLTRLLAR